MQIDFHNTTFNDQFITKSCGNCIYFKPFRFHKGECKLNTKRKTMHHHETCNNWVYKGDMNKLRRMKIKNILEDN